MSDPDWLPARVLYRRLISAGVAVSDVATVVAWGCLWLGLFATGFPRIHDGDQIAKGDDRTRISNLIWRAFTVPHPEIEHFVRWNDGQFTWIIRRENDGDLQETWDSVHFDRVSAASMVWEIKVRAQTDALQDWEIERWIETECRTENSKIAWSDFTNAHGPRRGKKETFDACWRRLKGERKRGRPPKTPPSP